MHTRKGTTIVIQQEKVTNKTRQQKKKNNLFQRLCSVRSFCCRESIFSYLRKAVFILSQANFYSIHFLKVRHFPGKIDNKPLPLGVEDENGQALFSSLEAFTSKIQGKAVRPRFLSNCVISLVHSGMPIKYDRTCQRSIKRISIEKTFALYKSAQKKHCFLEFFKRKLLMSSI